MFKEINILKIFFEEPEREFHLREIARIFKKNPVTIKKLLEEFVKEKVLLLRKERRFHIYSSNTVDETYKGLKRNYNKDKLADSRLIEYLKENLNLPAIILFGSFERGEDNKNSDVDICIITETKKEVDISKYERIIKKKIQLHVFDNKEFKNLRLKNNALFNNIINGSKVYGFLEIS